VSPVAGAMTEVQFSLFAQVSAVQHSVEMQASDISRHDIDMTDVDQNKKLTFESYDSSYVVGKGDVLWE
jgi:hypothetical protein